VCFLFLDPLDEVGSFISSSSFVLLVDIVVLDLFKFTYLIHLINSTAHSIRYCVIGSLTITEFRHMTSFRQTNTVKFYIHVSVHRESNLITVFQKDATNSVYYITAGSSTCFGC